MRLPNWLKLMIGFMAFLTCLVIAFDFTLYRAFIYNPEHITVSYQQIRSETIPTSMSQVSAVFLTDIEYSEENFSLDKATALFEQVRKLNPDVLLIGGDLFAWNANLTDEVQKQMIDWLSSIPAPLGKFAVFGEQDEASETHQYIVEDVYLKSQVELLNNRSVLLANKSNQGIRLGGLDTNADPSPLVPAFQGDQFNLLLSHFPDNFLIAQNVGLQVSYGLAGNSHGTQINWPILGGYKTFDGSIEIDRNHQQKLAFPYLISSGIGCIDVQARLNSPVEILYLTFINPNS